MADVAQSTGEAVGQVGLMMDPFSRDRAVCHRQQEQRERREAVARDKKELARLLEEATRGGFVRMVSSESKTPVEVRDNHGTRARSRETVRNLYLADPSHDNAPEEARCPNLQGKQNLASSRVPGDGSEACFTLTVEQEELEIHHSVEGKQCIGSGTDSPRVATDKTKQHVNAALRSGSSGPTCSGGETASLHQSSDCDLEPPAGPRRRPANIDAIYRGLYKPLGISPGDGEDLHSPKLHWTDRRKLSAAQTLPLSAPTTPEPAAPRIWLDAAVGDTNSLPLKIKGAVEDEESQPSAGFRDGALDAPRILF